MPITAIVIRIKDHNDDHEVGGLDLPLSITLSTASEHTSNVIEMMNASLGQFARINAFNIRVVSAGIITFSTFDNVMLGDQFRWADSVFIEQMLHQAHAKIENVIERSTLLALRDLKASGWNGTDPDAHSTTIFDGKGVLIRIGDWCRFSFADTGRAGIGWINHLGSHPVRPIAVCPLDEHMIGAIGARPAEIEVLPDFRI